MNTFFGNIFTNCSRELPILYSMKKIILSLIFCSTLASAFCQKFYNGSPGFSGGFELYDANGHTVNPFPLKAGTPLKLRVGFQNASFSNKIPNETLKIHIYLGGKMIINPSPAYNIANAPFNQYFQWTLTVNGPDQIITGIQKSGEAADIPPGFINSLEFEVQPSNPGRSSVVGNIMILNTNATEKTSDPIDNDNSSSIIYEVVALPETVKLSNMSVQKTGCNMNVNWIAKSSTGVSKYEIELSKDNVAYTPVALVGTHSSSTYISTFEIPEQFRTDKIYVRIKQTNTDDKIIYSQVLNDSGICNTKGKPA